MAGDEQKVNALIKVMQNDRSDAFDPQSTRSPTGCGFTAIGRDIPIIGVQDAVILWRGG
jgi:hypothetical protein